MASILTRAFAHRDSMAPSAIETTPHVSPLPVVTAVPAYNLRAPLPAHVHRVSMARFARTPSTTAPRVLACMARATIWSTISHAHASPDSAAGFAGMTLTNVSSLHHASMAPLASIPLEATFASACLASMAPTAAATSTTALPQIHV